MPLSSLGVFRFYFQWDVLFFLAKWERSRVFAAELSGFEAEKQWHGAIEPAIDLLVCSFMHNVACLPSYQAIKLDHLWVGYGLKTKCQKNKTEHGWLGLGVLIPTNPSPNPQTPPKCSSPRLSGEGYSLFIILTHVSHSCDDEGDDCHTSDSPHYDGHHELFWKSV